MHTTEMKMLRWIQGKTRKDRIGKKSSVAMQWSRQSPHRPICHPETHFVLLPCDEKRIHERCKESNNNECGREETSRNAQTKVDGQSAERFETTLARSKARTDQKSMEKGNHGDRPGQG